MAYWIQHRTTRQHEMKRSKNPAIDDLRLRLAARDYVTLAPERLRWTRPAPGQAVIVRDDFIALPARTELVPMGLPVWVSALEDFARGTRARAFAEKYGLLQ